MKPLDGPRRKIAIAKEDIDTLEYDSQRFFGRHVGGAIVSKRPTKVGTYALDIGDIELPIDWSVKVGEIAHDLRSALDGLVCQLAVISNPGSTWRICKKERTGFPIFLKGPRSSASEGFKRKKLPYLKRGFVTRIERLQPYKRRNGYRRGPLWLLRELNNADKHRIVVLIGGWNVGGGILMAGSEAAIERYEAGVQTKARAEAIRVVVATDKVGMKSLRFHHITFGPGCDAVEGLPVIRVLAFIAQEVEDIVESFSGEFP
jgi:hypothetical protein